MRAQLDTPWQVMFKCREQRSALHADGLKQGLTETESKFSESCIDVESYCHDMDVCVCSHSVCMSGVWSIDVKYILVSVLK